MRQIAILVETALASGRSLLAGISQFARERDDWQVFHPTGYLGSTDLTGLVDWRGEGIIARVSDPRTLQALKTYGVPVVDVLGNVPESPFPVVKSDDRAIGRRVAEAFLQHRHRHFAFIGLAGEVWSAEREAGYCEALESKLEAVRSCLLPSAQGGGAVWKRRMEALTGWLAQLPLPCAVMIASDQLGPTVMAACQRVKISVPEEISVIGVDNDVPFCELCRPSLSSVEPNHYQAGYEAARLLDRLLESGGTGSSRIEVPPIRLHKRASSEANAVQDPSLVKALQFIRAEACNGATVEEVARAAALSRSVLQRRFRAELNQTVLEVIHATKVRRAADLLKFTRLESPEVAERSGYSSPAYFTAAFKRATGWAPIAYRRRFGGHGPGAARSKDW
jgi:LacI family transcriptional regulator